VTERVKRSNTFTFCSPPNAIEPLPPASPETEPARLRTDKSSPFLTASASLRVFFGREGFVARSLSSAFDKDVNSTAGPRGGAKMDEVEAGGLKSKISAPLAASHDSVRKAEGEKQWRESVLAQAVSLSMSSSLNRLADPGGKSTGTELASQMAAGSSKPRLGIPAQLLAAATVTELGRLTEPTSTSQSPIRRRSGIAPPIKESTPPRECYVTPSEDGLETLAGIGEAMLRHGGLVNSIDSGLNLKPGPLDRFIASQDAPAVPLLSPKRTLGQIGGEDSMASASVQVAPTASQLRRR
jgi:hypothetical protein